MAILFPSPEWVEEFKKQVNLHPTYKQSASKWEAGPITLVVKAKSEIGLKEDTAILLDLHKGVCRDARVVSIDEGNKSPFVIIGEYDRWKQVIKKELEPIKGMMQGKLKLKGDLPTIVKYVKAAQDLVDSATKVPTQFIDEK